MSTNEAAERLAAAVKARRTEDLHLSQLEVTAGGGPSNTLQTDIENARIETLTPRTARKVDDGLGWEAGSAMRVWEGRGEPTPRRVGTTASGDLWITDNTQELAALREYIAAAGDHGLDVTPPAIALGLWEFEDLMQAAILKHRDEVDLLNTFVNVLKDRPRATRDALPTLDEARDAKQQRALEQGQPAAEAAYGDEEGTGPDKPK